MTWPQCLTIATPLWGIAGLLLWQTQFSDRSVDSVPRPVGRVLADDTPPAQKIGGTPGSDPNLMPGYIWDYSHWYPGTGTDAHGKPLPRLYKQMTPFPK